MFYTNLDDALNDIAARSFYESARVTKEGNGYTVEDWYTGVEESVMWTYETGAEVPSDALDYSRTHEPYEFYDRASHIRFNLPTAVETIEEGTPVGFTYAIADAYCEDDVEECQEDHTAGWLLIATTEGN